MHGHMWKRPDSSRGSQLTQRKSWKYIWPGEAIERSKTKALEENIEFFVEKFCWRSYKMRIYKQYSENINTSHCFELFLISSHRSWMHRVPTLDTRHLYDDRYLTQMYSCWSKSQLRATLMHQIHRFHCSQKSEQLHQTTLNFRAILALRMSASILLAFTMSKKDTFDSSTLKEQQLLPSQVG